MKILALGRSYSFQADYNKLFQNEHLLILEIGNTLYLFYAWPKWLLVPSWRHSTKRKKKLKLSKSKKLTVLFFWPRICDWLQVMPCFLFSCSRECLPGWSKCMQEERQCASCANHSGWHSNFMATSPSAFSITGFWKGRGKISKHGANESIGDICDSSSWWVLWPLLFPSNCLTTWLK